MKNNRGFIELKNVADFWNKLQFDFQELKKNPENSYIIFNFFVTAYHLIDWIFEGEYSIERTELNNNSIVKICNHISNGIKHFEPDRHGSVEEIEKFKIFEEGVVEKGIFESPIIIYFDDQYFSEFGKSMKITEFAELVMLFWKNELIRRSLI